MLFYGDDFVMYEEITEKTRSIVVDILEKSALKKGDIFIVGCSTSTVFGDAYGSCSSMDIAKALFEGIYPELLKREIYLAAQCCEHLNRAVIIPQEAAEKLRLDTVNVVPQPKAGGSFATLAYEKIDCPVAVEHIRANAGMDIGGVLIGMHLKEVAVPLNLENNMIGKAHITAARTRPKFIGGERAHYNDDIK